MFNKLIPMKNNNGNNTNNNTNNLFAQRATIKVRDN